ncbi:MAG: adenylyl-sulfate kinase, partial [Candidatus Xenobia bacterium]
LSLLTDGLKAEREQGITIDVAYRYFATERRKFVIADTPGHEQYTRNMATGASTCDLAIILLDARLGVLPQTRRHSYIASLLGIKHLLVAVNKMDLVDWSETAFNQIRAAYEAFSSRLGVSDVSFIPMSARLGDNVVHRSTRMPWYQGSPLLEYLETVHLSADRNLADFRFPVQVVIRPNLEFRGLAGTIASGVVRVDDEVMLLPSAERCRVKELFVAEVPQEFAFAGQAVTLTLDRDVDASRGDMLVHPQNVPYQERELEATLVWMDGKPLEVGGSYWLKQTTSVVPATVSSVGQRIDVETLQGSPASGLRLNEIGQVTLTLSRPVFYDPYKLNRATGSFVLIDRVTNATAGAGMILTRQPREALKSTVLARQSAVTAEMRSTAFKQRPVTVWITGLPVSGKSAVAYGLEKRLFDCGHAAYAMDGSTMRTRINVDLGFAALDRSENIRRLAEVARTLCDAGLIAVCAAISPYAADRDLARRIVGAERFLEIHCSAPLEVCESRDTDGLYARARKGEIAAFTGVSAPYETPESPDLRLRIDEASLDDLVDRVEALLVSRGFLT